ncbi:MAG: hypothetical protein WCR06_10720, partial [bacterium]
MTSLRQTGSGRLSACVGLGRPETAEKRFLVNRMTMPLKSKYKALHGAVQSFSEGITGLLCAGFHELARHAIQSSTSSYHLDFLAQSSTPDIPMTDWRQWLFTYFKLNEWFDAIGCSLAHIRKVEMDAEFDMTS